MIGLDTNVLARFLMQDDPLQSPAASRVMASLTSTEPGFICREVMVELVWVLNRAYALPRAVIASTIDRLLETAELVIEDADKAAIAADRYRKGGAGFADQMIALAGLAAGCETVVTFDRQGAGVPGMQVLTAT